MSKEKETAEHKIKVKVINSKESDVLVIYTDNSKTEQSESLDAGLVIRTEQKYQLKSWNIGKYNEVFDAELYAILQAFKIA